MMKILYWTLNFFGRTLYAGSLLVFGAWSQDNLIHFSNGDSALIIAILCFVSGSVIEGISAAMRSRRRIGSK